MENFFEKLKLQLEKMTPEEKDAWILEQAKILPEWKQEDFYKSVCGTKKVIDMLERDEITEFCEKVSNGEITVKYETHYVEFDDFGHYHDGWEHDFYDPDYAMTFVSSVLSGCHDLIVLEEYGQAFEILDEILELEFTIEDTPDTEDSCQDEFMDLNMAAEERMLTIDREELLRDYIIACRYSVKDCVEAAGKIVSAFENELFEDCGIQSCIALAEKDPLLKEIGKKLTEELEKFEKEHAEKIRKNPYYWKEYSDRERIKRIKGLIEYFGNVGKSERKKEKSFLRGTWSQIAELISELKDEPYIDDQLQIEEIWDIVEALLKRGRFEEEPWNVKESILRKIYENDYYDCYGICDPMRDLAGAICSTKEENLKRAGIMMRAGGGYLGADAAKLYRELGEEDKCAEYFRNHLGKDEEPYEILIDYYKKRDHEKAVEVAALAIQKCQKDQTPFFLFLLQDAKERGDEAAFKKLMQSAHRRKAVNSAEVDAKFPEEP